MKFFWKAERCGAELNAALRRVAEQCADRLAEGRGERELEFREGPSGVVKVTSTESGFRIESGTLSGLLRGVGQAFAGLEGEENTPFRTLGIMLDCSRNKVFAPAYLRELFVKLALMGYNLVMLYTEDTYQLPEEPFFGYMRGAYTLEELRGLDASARELGIELVGCIQTLGHCEQLLAYPEYGAVRDTPAVLMVDEPKTYELIEKMIQFWSEALTSRRLHIGMDEAHELGRGRFLDRNGYQEAYPLFARHLRRVAELCARYGVRPIIWDDMYFRLGNPDHEYYTLETEIPATVLAQIPENLQLCYWDYYTADADFYRKFIDLHRSFGCNPIMGSGVWTWGRFWYDHRTTCRSAIPCLQACRDRKLDEIFFTMWGDNGGYCAYDSALAGLEFVSGLAYGHEATETDFFADRFRAVCGADFELYTALGEVALNDEEAASGGVTAHLLWDDPLLGINYLSLRSRDEQLPERYAARLAALAAKLETAELTPALREIRALIRFLKLRPAFQRRLLQTFRDGDREALRALAEGELPELIAALDEFAAEFRADWLRSAKPFGLEVIQRRNAGLRERLLELRRRLLHGEPLPELEAQLAALELGVPTPSRMYSGSILL